MLQALFSFSGTIERRPYIRIALVGVLCKLLIDQYVTTHIFDLAWSPLNYLIPLGVPVSFGSLTLANQTFLATMLAISLPFAWVGLAITTKRFRSIGWPAWTVVLFFVPIANLVSFAIAAMWSQPAAQPVEGSPRWLARLVPREPWGAAAIASVFSAILAVGLVALGTRTVESYGWGLFAVIPFSQGALAAYLFGVHGERGIGESVRVAMLSTFLTLLALLAVALEGAICVAMAAPLAFAFAALGALFGHTIQRRVRTRINVATLLVLVLVSPAIMGAEAAVPRGAPIYSVRSEVIIDAPPMTVWRNVVQFPDLPPPTEAIFQLGVAYPERAKIVGSGVGAVRYCEFSTGNFVEPITVWEPGKVLAFSVRQNPEPMHELSPYAGLQTAHLHGYMISLHGEFRLEALPGGRTRLVGTTWYEHHLWPAAYWALYSNAIVHSIHMRVLDQIKRTSESEAT